MGENDLIVTLIVGHLKEEIIQSLIQGCIYSPLIESYIKNFLTKHVAKIKQKAPFVQLINPPY